MGKYIEDVSRIPVKVSAIRNRKATDSVQSPEDVEFAKGFSQALSDSIKNEKVGSCSAFTSNAFSRLNKGGSLL